MAGTIYIFFLLSKIVSSNADFKKRIKILQ